MAGAFAIAALLLAPHAALAANECAPAGTDPADNGAAADTFDCAAGTYAGGINYGSAGNLTVNASGAVNVGAAGLKLSGNGADDLTLNASGAITGTAGPVLQLRSAAGDIDVSVAGVTASAADATYGIDAGSSGGGNVAVHATGAVNAGAGFQGSTIKQSAIKAVSSGGNGNVSVTTDAAVTGNLYGIDASAGGSGTLTISVGGGAVDVSHPFSIGGAGAPPGIAAINATTGSGLLSIELRAGTGNVGVGSSAGILAHAGGDAQIDIGTGRSVAPAIGGFGATTTGAALIDITAAGTATIHNAGTLSSSGDSMLTLRAAGGSLLFDNSGTLSGNIDVSALTGTSTLNNGGTIQTDSTITVTGLQNLRNTGTITLGSSNSNGGDAIVFDGLQTFDNSGVILFGGRRNRANQLVAAPGAAFTGEPGSLLVMDATLDGQAQTGCGANTSADCFDLSGGSTSGQTAIRLTAIDRIIDPAGGADLTPFTGAITKQVNAGIVLVDVSGGTGHAGDFVLDPGSTSYADDPRYGGVIKTGGLFDYALLYDPGTQQFVLASAPQRQAAEYASFIHEALSIWHTTSDAVAGRQADLRNGTASAGSFWVRTIAEQTRRNAGPVADVRNNRIALDQDDSLYTAALIAGYDVAAGADYVIGLHAGVVKSSFNVTDSETSDDTTGATAGLYGSWWNAATGLTLDGTLNTNALKLDHKPSGFEKSSSNILSYGTRLEAGWRVPLLGEALYVQPLLTGAYARADIKHLLLRDYDLRFKDADSLRGAVGLRVGGADGGLGYWLTARAWNEFSGDGRVEFATTGKPLAIEDDLGGAFQEVGFGVSLANAANTLSGFLAGGAKFADDTHDDYNVSLGVRLSW